MPQRKKLLDEDLIAWVDKIEAGEATQKEVAMLYDVSESAICQRLQKLRRQEAPESFRKLTHKQRRYVLNKVAGQSNIEACRNAYDVTSRDSAKALSNSLSKDQNIGRAIDDILFEHGLSISHRIERLKFLINHSDPTSVYRGLDMAAKMTGQYAPVKVDGQYTEIIAMIMKIKSEEGNNVVDITEPQAGE